MFVYPYPNLTLINHTQIFFDFSANGLHTAHEVKPNSMHDHYSVMGFKGLRSFSSLEVLYCIVVDIV